MNMALGFFYSTKHFDPVGQKQKIIHLRSVKTAIKDLFLLPFASAGLKGPERTAEQHKMEVIISYIVRPKLYFLHSSCI